MVSKRFCDECGKELKEEQISITIDFHITEIRTDRYSRLDNESDDFCDLACAAKFLMNFAKTKVFIRWEKNG